MMHYWTTRIFAFLIAVLLVVSMPVRAAKPSALDLAVTQVQEQTGGRILRAGPVRDESGQLLFRIKVLLPDGRIKIFWINPDNG